MSQSSQCPELPFYLPGEIALHNKPDDCWVAIMGKVYDITELIQVNKPKLVRSLIAFAGKDLSGWFEAETGDLKTCVHPVTGVRVTYLQHGSIPDSSFVPAYPTSAFDTSEHTPWWKTDKYLIGQVKKQVRVVKFCNMLTAQVWTTKVFADDTFNTIAERIRPFNSTPHEYIWRQTWTILEQRNPTLLGVTWSGNLPWNTDVRQLPSQLLKRRLDGTEIDMNKTMEENGIPDETERFEELGMPASRYIPIIKLDFKDERGMTDDEDDDSSTDSDSEGFLIRRIASVKFVPAKRSYP